MAIADHNDCRKIGAAMASDRRAQGADVSTGVPYG
jgi:hypothetical protein